MPRVRSRIRKFVSPQSFSHRTVGFGQGAGVGRDDTAVRNHGEAGGCQMAEGEQTAIGGITRRKAIKLGAVAGGAMWAAPAIHSMAAGASTGSSPCQSGQTFCSGAGCPGCGNSQLVNGTCAKPCTVDSDCASGHCTSLRCTSTAFGGNCNTDSDCRSGFFCAGTLCLGASC